MKNKYLNIVFILFLINIASKLTGILRESFIAKGFGVSQQIDAYNIAIIIPFLLFSLIGPAISTTLIPILSEIFETQGKKKMFDFANNVINIVMIFTSFLCCIGLCFPNFFVELLAPGFDENTKNIAINLTSISIINVLFIGLNYGFIAILNVLGEFTSTSLTGLMLNIPIIIYIFFQSNYDITHLMIFTMIGYGLQIICHIPFLFKHQYQYRFIIDFKNPNIKKMILLVVPILVGIGINQLNVIVDRVMASGLQDGVISSMNYANKANDIMYTLFSSSIVVIIFPILSKSANKCDNYKEFSTNLLNFEKLTLLIMLPITFLILYLREDILTVLYKYGAFDNEALELTLKAFYFLSFSTIFYSLRDIYNKGLLSMQDTKSSMINTSIGMIVNIVLNLFTVKKLGIIGLSLSTTFSAMVTCLLLRRSIFKKINNLNQIKFKKIEFFKVILSTLIMAIILILIDTFIIGDLNSFFNVLINGILAGAIYLFILYLLKIEEINYIREIFIKKFKYKC